MGIISFPLTPDSVSSAGRASRRGLDGSYSSRMARLKAADTGLWSDVAMEGWAPYARHVTSAAKAGCDFHSTRSHQLGTRAICDKRGGGRV
jgi:hypothetical protein